MLTSNFHQASFTNIETGRFISLGHCACWNHSGSISGSGFSSVSLSQLISSIRGDGRGRMKFDQDWQIQVDSCAKNATTSYLPKPNFNPSPKQLHLLEIRIKLKKSSNKTALNAKLPFIPETLRFLTFSLMIGPSNACRFRPKRLWTLSVRFLETLGKFENSTVKCLESWSTKLIYKNTSNIRCIVTQ